MASLVLVTLATQAMGLHAPTLMNVPLTSTTVIRMRNALIRTVVSLVLATPATKATELPVSTSTSV